MTISNLVSSLYLVDLGITILLLVAFISGFKSGLFQGILKSFGYVLGGLIGLYLSIHVNFDKVSQIQKYALQAVTILISALLTQYLARKLGLLVHHRLLILPLRAVDSLLGGIVAMILTSVVIYWFALLTENFYEVSRYSLIIQILLKCHLGYEILASNLQY